MYLIVGAGRKFIERGNTEASGLIFLLSRLRVFSKSIRKD